MEQFQRMGEEPAPRPQHVHGARASPLQQNRAAERYDVLPVLGILHHRPIRTGHYYGHNYDTHLDCFEPSTAPRGANPARYCSVP